MNQITFSCLGVRSIEKAIKFYRDNQGFKIDEKRDNPERIF